jgi:hemerythrin-like metal-binding protein
MSFFSWQDNFAFGVESIDNDHQKLVALIDELYTAMSQGKGKTIIDEVVNELVNYTKTHFRREEFFMKSTAYPAFDAHKKAHDNFVARVTEYHQMILAGKDNITVEVLSFLRDWLSHHILNVDKATVPHLKKYGIK